METEIIKHALACDEKYQERLKLEAITLTGVKNPNSAAQMKKWLFEKEGLQVESLSKEMVAKLLQEEGLCIVCNSYSSNELFTPCIFLFKIQLK